MYDRGIKSRCLGPAFAAIALIALVAACGSDPEPTSTPTPESTPIPTPTPTPTPTPEATPTPEPTTAPVATSTPSTAQPDVTLDSLVVTDETTGMELMDKVSEAESFCVREAFGNFIFEVYLNIPIMQSGAAESESAASMAASMFGCLTPDNAVLLGAAFVDYEAGGFEPASRACIVEVGRERPDMLFVSLGLSEIQEDLSVPSGTQPYTVELFNCLTDFEKVELLARHQKAFDSHTTVRDHVIPVLTESEQTCIREGHSSTGYTALLGSTVMETFTPGSALSNCISEESYLPIFMAITESQAGGLSEGSQGCLIAFGENHPQYVALVGAGEYEVSSLTEEQLLEFAQDGLRHFECLNDDELHNMEALISQALASS